MQADLGLEVVFKYFPDLPMDQKLQLKEMGPLYQYWNARINLISRNDINFLYERHILYSLAIAKAIFFLPGTRILDLGTGGGFPGIPLAVVFPEVDFLLVDSKRKKIKVVQEVVKALNLKNVETLAARVETIEGSFDFVTGRAVTDLPKMMLWVEKKIKRNSLHSIPNGFFYLKGGDFKKELEFFRKKQVYELKEWFEESFFETKKLVYLPVSL